MAKEPPEMSAEEETLLRDRLPWYVNGTLGESERIWIAKRLLYSPRARSLLAREQDLAQSIQTNGALIVTDHGVDGFVQKLNAEKMKESASSAGSALKVRRDVDGTVNFAEKIRDWVRWLTFPQIAGAMAVIIVLQFGLISWVLVDQSPDNEQLRSIPVAEMRTLRVTVLPTTTELQFREALIAASARLVGGPNQYGEYWIASPMVSMDEMTAILRKTGLFEQITPDKSGPLPLAK